MQCNLVTWSAIYGRRKNISNYKTEAIAQKRGNKP